MKSSHREQELRRYNAIFVEETCNLPNLSLKEKNIYDESQMESIWNNIRQIRGWKKKQLKQWIEAGPSAPKKVKDAATADMISELLPHSPNSPDLAPLTFSAS